MTRLLPVLIAGALLSGCVLGPRYRSPTLSEAARAPLISVSPQAETTASPPDDWWRLYDDPLLNKLMVQAFAANADLKAAEANLSVARAALEASRAGLYPSTTTETEAVRGRDAVTDEILELTARAPQTIWIFDALFDVSYEVDLFGRVRRTIEASKADAEAAAASRDALKITVAAETARAYAQICTLGEQLAVANHSLAVVSREEKITHDQLAAGGTTVFDVVRAQGLVAQVRSSIPPLEGQRRAALFELAALLGLAPRQAPTEAEACVTPPHLASLIPVGDGAALLKRRPDVRLADRQLAAATARIGVAMADLYPRVTLTGFYGGLATDIPDLFRNVGLTWGVGPQISWSFPNQVAPRARVRQARAETEEALDLFDSTVLQALKETEQALSIYGTELDHRQALAEAQDRAKKAFDIADAQFLAGGIADIDLLDSERTLVDADAAVASSDAALAQDQIGLFKALGGGWQSTASPTQSSASLEPIGSK